MDCVGPNHGCDKPWITLWINSSSARVSEDIQRARIREGNAPESED